MAEKRSKFKKKRFWVMMILVLFVAWTFWPLDMIVVEDGADTTVVMGYGVGEFNRTDYGKYLNEKRGAGVVAEDNAGVWLARMVGRDYFVDALGGRNLFGVDMVIDGEPLVGRLLDGLGIDGLEKGGLERWSDYAKGVNNAARKKEGIALMAEDGGVVMVDGKFVFQEPEAVDVGDYEDVIGFDDEPSMGGPWLKKDYPHLAKYVEATDRFLEMFVRGSRCSRFYLPLIKKHEKNLISSGLMFRLGLCRSGAMSIQRRGMLRLGESDVSGALADGLGVVRMGRLMRAESHSFLIERLVGLSVEETGYGMLLHVVRADGFTKEMGEGMFAEIAGMKQPAAMIEVLDKSERFVGLDYAQGLGLGEFDLTCLNSGLSGDRIRFVEGDSVGLDVNQLMRVVNEKFDEDLLGLKRGVAGVTKGDEADLLFMAIEELRLLPNRWVRGLLTRKVGELIHTPDTVATVRSLKSKDSIGESIARLRFGFALVQYRVAFGEYPKTLDLLVGKYGLEALPKEVLGADGKAMLYEVNERGNVKLFELGGDGGRVEMGLVVLGVWEDGAVDEEDDVEDE